MGLVLIIGGEEVGLSKSLYREVTLKYILAIAIIASLSTIAFYVLKTVLKESEHTAQIVNISGKQRMLSQHIALDIYRIHDLIMHKNNFYPNSLLMDAFQNRINEMREANIKLSTGKLSVDERYILSKQIQEMYFGKMNLAKRVQKYLDVAEQVFDIANNEGLQKILNEINLQSEPLLRDLNKVVKQYEIEGKSNIANLKNLETTVWILTLIALLLEIIFIFQPMARHIAELKSKNEEYLQHLEDTVEIRTLHLEEANRKLKELAFHDSLTGLKNRLNMENDIENAINKEVQNKAPFAVLMFDIDWFKKVNDEMGHDTGDYVLKEIARIFLGSIRESDSAYRSGGEEFVLLLNRISLNDAQSIAKKIKDKVQKHVFSSDGKEFSKTMSCGLYHSSLLPLDKVSSILKSVDVALYKSKTNGRNRISLVSEKLKDKLEKIESSHIKITFQDFDFDKVVDIEIDQDINLYKHIENIIKQKKRFVDLVHHEDMELLHSAPKNASKQNPYVTTIRMYKDDEHIEIFRAMLFKEKNNLVLLLEESSIIAEGVSDKILLQGFQSMLENTDDYIYFKDRNHVFIGASKTLVSLTTVDKKEDLIGKVDYDVFSNNELSDKYFELERKVFDEQLEVAQDVQPTLDKDGNQGYVDNRKYPMHDENGNVIGLFGIARVIKNTKRLKNDL